MGLVCHAVCLFFVRCCLDKWIKIPRLIFTQISQTMKMINSFASHDIGFSKHLFFQTGYYADIAARCQVFRVCANTANNTSKGFGFLCPNGTLFNQGKAFESVK